jgi:hypothetical protein
MPMEERGASKASARSRIGEKERTGHARGEGERRARWRRRGAEEGGKPG